MLVDCSRVNSSSLLSAEILVGFGAVGNPISILDGIFVAIKDDIDCYPHPSKGKLSSPISLDYLLGRGSYLCYVYHDRWNNMDA